ncbi:hybrid sensor histidine kinase/response regulator [Bacteroides oleiciplenus]|uniref:hybrid sensor histidine kinase/response regulator n=1 Tax=Bacteroides oleiciplenus TaxID=626931 RepID=UPI0026DAC528|nr:hybrid sensor histidine kinase/response regulator transcription factor [Bacteroides oleiciplenus]
MKYTVLILFLSLAFYSEAILSQELSYNIKHYKKNSGLSQNTVMSIYQDSKGFIWAGTKNGLNRFDGSNFKTYQRGDLPDDLKNSVIFSIKEDKTKRLWIATDKGISLYDPFTERFSTFDIKTTEQETISGYVNEIFIDHQDRVWIRSNTGLYIYIDEENKLFCLNEKFRPYVGTPIPSAFYVDDNGIAYIAFPKIGILKYNFVTHEVDLLTSFTYSPTAMSGYNDSYMLVGTLNRGLYLVNKITGATKKIPVYNPQNSDIYVRTIEKISDTEYWIGTESGIYILQGEQIHHLAHDPHDNLSLSDNAIYSIFKDREGNVWVGSYFGGMDYILVESTYFRNYYPKVDQNSIQGYKVREFVNDKEGNLWIATEDNGLNYFNTETKQFTHISESSKPLSVTFSNIQSLNLVDDKLWVGTFSKGFDVLDLKTGRSKHYEKKDNDYTTIQNNHILAIYTDRNGITWIGSSSDIYTYVPEIDGVKKFEKIKQSFTSDILEDHNGNIWFSTYNRGVIRYNPYTDTIKEFTYDEKDPHSICYDRITGIFQDSKLRLWFSSEDGGFCLYHPKDETFTRITMKEGLPSNVVYKILEDNDQQLWLSTLDGIVHFDPETMSVKKQYDLSNGLENEQFNYNSGIKGKDGILYFGSIDGFISFNPQAIKDKKNRYSVVLTDLFIYNQKVKVDTTTSILKRAMPYTDVINLNYDQSTFSLGFSALNYSMNGQGKYAYQLEGIDKKWMYADNITQVSYNSIPPGSYTFRIKYSIDGYDWEGEETMLHINIIPPFWSTLEAYVVYAIILIVIFYMLLHYYIKRRKKRMEEEQIRQEHEKKDEIYKLKIDFFTNIAHEIRTPISLIKAPLDCIIHEDLCKDEMHENLGIIEKNTDRLLVLVNQLLDFRKVESKAFTLNFQVKNVCSVVYNTYVQFIATAKHRDIMITFDSLSDPLFALIDEEAITKVCSNLFNNAIKYSTSYVKIALSVDHDSQDFCITVRNDGTPIPVEMRQRIFEAFFRINDGNQDVTQPGSGIGLTLAASLVQLHNGKLYLDDKAEDICFVVQIPINMSADNSRPELDECVSKVEYEEDTPLSSEIQISDRKIVLVVEDNEELRSFLSRQLGRYYEIVAVSNGVEALAVLDEKIINLIVSDIMMPLMDGLELCNSIKNDLSTCHIPVILLTAKTALDNKIEGLKSGADAYIEKPFSMPYLLVQINNLLESRMKLRQNFANDPYIAIDSIAHNKADEDFLNKITDIIRQNLSDEKFSIDDLAMEVTMSRSSLHRKLRGITGLTPGDFVRIIRLKKAAELLKTGEYRINEICVLIGMNSISHFSKVFYKQFGVLPKDFAKKQAK